jgi:beta-lactamase class A
MNEIADVMDLSLPEHGIFHPTRREFIGAMALGSAGLLLGVPSFADAASNYPLNYQVNALVKRLRAKGVIRSDERTAWSVYDFTTRKKLVAINEDVPLQAASMIKPFVAQAFFYQAHNSRKVRYTADVRRTMERMIRRSSNTATNRLMSIVSRNEGNRGPRDVERVLKRYGGGIFRETRIVENIPAGGRTYRNLASAHDYSRFLYALWNDKLPYARELRAIMALPNRDRISDGVNSVPANVKIYDKTGSTARLCGNMGIVEAPGRRGGTYPYTFIGIIEKSSRAKNYGSWITRRSNAIREVSNLVYLEMKQRHRLV